VLRTTPSDRLPKLLDAAAATFVEHGFQRTQMDDIADRLGVSKVIMADPEGNEFCVCDGGASGGSAAG
jgi:hypothetical protein